MDIRMICYALSLLLIATPALPGGIKKWVDAGGGVHFGDTAPYGTDATLSNPVITVTEPASENTLHDILRPGERRMLRSYEQRGRRLSKAKKRSLKQARQKERKKAQMEDKCFYHKQKKDELEQKLKRGYKSSQKISIVRGIDRHRLLIKRYCI